MENIEELILQFSTLRPDKQRELEARAEERPEWKALLEEVKALEALCREMRLLQRPNDELLAYYVVVREGYVEAPTALRQAFEALEARLSNEPALQVRYEAMAERLDMFTSSFDAESQFETLTGFAASSLTDLSASDPREPSEEAVNEAPSAMASVLSLPRALQWAIAAIVLVALLYGGLYAASWVLHSDAERLALVDPRETQVEGYQLTLRGAQSAPEKAPMDALYLQALQILRDAQTTTLGLFPRYDQEKLAQAERLLQRVIENEESRSFLQMEAHFFLGKVYLAQGKIEKARSNFQTVAICEGRRTPEAVEILTELQKRYPAHGQSHLG
jgi:tetratricopeptide (TPR) repeat protein